MTEENKIQVKAVRYVASVLCFLQYGTELPELYEGLTYKDVFVAAKAHSLASTVWYAVEDKVRSEGNEELIKRWESERELDFAKHLIQSAEFDRLTKIFSENKISFLPLKGFLFKELWSKPEYRTMGDMDFYFAEEDIPKVTELLYSLGYKADIEDGEVHDTFDKPPFLHVEAHKALRRGSKESFESWIPKEDNPYWYTMDPVSFAVFNIAHAHKHFTSGGCGIRNLFDLHLLFEHYRNEINYEAMQKRLFEEGLSEFFDIARYLIELYFKNSGKKLQTSIHGTKVNEECSELELFIATGGTYGSVRNRVKYRLKNKSKFGYVISRAFPSYAAMTRYYKWLKKAPFLLPFAYVARIFASLFNGKAKREFSAIEKANK